MKSNEQEERNLERKTTIHQYSCTRNFQKSSVYKESIVEKSINIIVCLENDCGKSRKKENK